ncbi:MAG: hypothetical protein ACRD0D_07510 [Acidimicrobiales bacterium]
MLVIDEYLAVRVLGGGWPAEMPDDELGLPASRHWRLLQRVHAPGGGQLSQLLDALPGGDLTVVRFPHPEVLQVLDPRPLLDSAASIAARYGAGGLLIAETLAAGLAHGRQLWFGLDRNVGRSMARIADELGITINVADT